jgi:hypothetical protein
MKTGIADISRQGYGKRNISLFVTQHIQPLIKGQPELADHFIFPCGRNLLEFRLDQLQIKQPVKLVLLHHPGNISPQLPAFLTLPVR